MSEIRVVLVEPSHPGNIGAVARAMRNMALESLVLVRPRQFPHPEATARASGAESVLAGARVVGTVAEAIAGCGFIAATTARDRDQNFRVLEARAAAARILEAAASQPAAILFGAERTGLVNEDLETAHVLVRIPADQAYASLNLAMAVQIVAYEIYTQKLALEGRRGVAPEQADGTPEERSGGTRPGPPAGLAPGLPGWAPRGLPGAVPLATPEDMERLYAHLGEVMQEVGFRDRTQSGTHLMARIRRFLQRAELDSNEANILRGLLTAIQGRRRPAGSKVVSRKRVSNKGARGRAASGDDVDAGAGRDARGRAP